MIDFAIVKAWLDSCEHNVAGTGHDVVEPPVTHDFAPSRLIDIERYCVVRSARRNYRYIALSYVWGGPQSLRLLLGNESRLMAPNGLLASGRDLPQTIHDAIEATRKLGERYLWIDALCIIQDDREFKQAELLLMGRIYARALLTIVAAYGRDVHAGLPGVSVVQRSAPQHVEYIHDMGLTNRLPTLSATVDQSVWNSRAWTFQERVLAKRKLYITKHQAMFICPHTEVELREDVYGSAIRPSETSNRSRREAGLHKYRLVPYNPDGSVPPSVNTAIYSSIVQQFCRRQTSFPAELLNIFAGITDYLAPYFRSTFIMGLPVSELDTQLLWRHFGPIIRRVSRDTGRSLFPSWSWAGWTGARAGYIANARGSSALELHESDSDSWLTMDEIRGNDADIAWRLHDFYRGSFWRREDETANYYAHPIATSESHAAFRPTLLSNNLGISEILPLRSEVIKVNVTGATNPDADRIPALSTCHDSVSYQRALSLFNAKDVLVGTAFIPLSVSKTLEPGSYDFVKIATVATGPDFIDRVDEYMDFLLCYACDIYGVSKADSQDRIDGLLLRTEDGISYRLGVAVCHVAAFESAHPTRTVVHLG
nr:hypothetical protein B0A51_09928 [Rachicladosporium sp. CCFEE 5018]